MRAMSIALILFVTLGLATNATAARYPFGLKGGLAWSKWTGEVPDHTYHRTSIMAGAFVEFPLGDHFSIQPELLYAGRGTNLVIPRTIPRDVTKFKRNYLELPILAKYNWVFGSSEPYVLLGPSVNFLTSASIVIDEASTDLEDPSRVEFGMVAAFGLKMRGIILEGRYSYGLTEPSDLEDQYGYVFDNRVFGLVFGVIF